MYAVGVNCVKEGENKRKNGCTSITRQTQLTDKKKLTKNCKYCNELNGFPEKGTVPSLTTMKEIISGLNEVLHVVENDRRITV